VFRPDPEPNKLTDLMDNANTYMQQMEVEDRRWDSDERFEVSRSFLEWSGFAVIAPYSDGFDGDALDRVAQLQICGGRHIAYLEKDATVNLIDAATAIGRASGYTTVFRNRGPLDPRVEIVGHGTPPN
jgi:hypothetical protein